MTSQYGDTHSERLRELTETGKSVRRTGKPAFTALIGMMRDEDHRQALREDQQRQQAAEAGTGTMSTMEAAAAQLGTEHGSEGSAPFGDLDDAGSGDLMTALGETGETTDANFGYRVSLLDAYRDAWEAAAGRYYPIGSEAGECTDPQCPVWH